MGTSPIQQAFEHSAGIIELHCCSQMAMGAQARRVETYVFEVRAESGQMARIRDWNGRQTLVHSGRCACFSLRIWKGRYAVAERVVPPLPAPPTFQRCRHRPPRIPHVVRSSLSMSELQTAFDKGGSGSREELTSGRNGNPDLIFTVV